MYVYVLLQIKVEKKSMVLKCCQQFKNITWLLNLFPMFQFERHESIMYNGVAFRRARTVT